MNADVLSLCLLNFERLLGGVIRELFDLAQLGHGDCHFWQSCDVASIEGVGVAVIS